MSSGRAVCLGTWAVPSTCVLSLQGDPVIGVCTNLGATAEECVIDQKVWLLLSTQGHVDFLFDFQFPCLSSSHRPSFAFVSL